MNKFRRFENSSNEKNPFGYEIKSTLGMGPKYSVYKTSRYKNKNETITPGPQHYHIPCSIRDVPQFVRKNKAFDENFTFIWFFSKNILL